MTKPTLPRYGARRLTTAVVLTLALATAFAGPTLAAKRTSGGSNSTTPTGSISLVMVKDLNGNGAPNWADSITWTVSTTATSEPHVSLQCSQSGVLVYSTQSGYYAGYAWPWTQTMVLSSGAWTGGAADCVAQLYYFSGRNTIYDVTYRFTAGA